MTDECKLAELEKRVAVVERRLGLDPRMPVGPIGQIVRDMAGAIGQQPYDLTGSRRHGALVRGRFAIAWAASKGLHATLGEIGADLGDRDHTTILNAIRRAEQLRDADPHFRKLTDWLLSNVNERNVQ